jgi:2-dehydro-3-deoxygalactonokinase
MTVKSSDTRWIAADTCNGQLSAWLIQDGAATAAETAEVQQAGARAALEDLARTWNAEPGTRVLMSGLEETPTAEVPAALPDPVQVSETGFLAIDPLPGLRQKSPAAIMRSAPVRIRGFLSARKDWDGVICLPGQTTHWAHVSAGEVVSFQSFMTVQLARAAAPAVEPALDGLADTAADALSKPERLAAMLAEARAAQALGTENPSEGSARVWGSLLGAELAAARPYWLGQQVALVAPEGLAPLYAEALLAQGVLPEQEDAAKMTLAGLLDAGSSVNL